MPPYWCRTGSHFRVATEETSGHAQPPLHTDVVAWRHSRATRFVHAGLALAIVTQLLISLWMHGPDEAQAGDILFQVHRYSGLTATVLTFGLWALGFG